MWDVGNVQRFEGTFQFATVFNIDICAWDVSSGTEFVSMFNGASGFNQDLCLWGNKILMSPLGSASLVSAMFSGSACTTDSDPTLTDSPPGPLCHVCV